jgi:hypothetical protein
MKQATAIACVLVDVGGVLLTDGWDHHARKRAASPFNLNWAETEERHHLTFEPKASVHARSVSAFHVRAIQTVPGDDRSGGSAQDPARAEDRSGEQRSART